MRRISYTAAGLLLLCICFLIQWELISIRELAAKGRGAVSKAEEARSYYALYENIWKDLVYFPIPTSVKNEKADVSYENSWMFERSYGGSYGHEGTDLMAGIKERGYYPVVSMTDGAVEEIGWLEKGGWRIGIRSQRDIYYYYAHLDSYAADFKKGDPVLAGTLLGFMGDSGYGKAEGTKGKFDVHLHVGIYVRTKELPELAVNPYWFLKSLEGNRLAYDY